MKYKMTVYYEGDPELGEDHLLNGIEARFGDIEGVRFEGAYIQAVSFGQREEAIKLAGTVLKNGEDND